MKRILLLVVIALAFICSFAHVYNVITINGKHYIVDVAKVDSSAFSELESYVPDTIFRDVIKYYYVHDTISYAVHDTVPFVVHDTIQVVQRDTIYTTDGGHEYVDLGLPSGTLWATCNVGASTPEEYGDYFAWGETTPQSDNAYSWSSYKWCNGSETTLTKYCTSSIYGTVDKKTKLDPEDDAATANWGSNWCMPTQAQQQELVNSSYTNTTWTTQNGVKGRVITSKTNGKSIFLPAAGDRDNGSLNFVGSYGYYWSSEVYSRNLSSSWLLYFGSGSVGAGYGSDRYYGRSVRAVRQ